MPEPLTIMLVVAAFLIGGFVKGAIGLGLPVVVLAMLALVMPLREAMAVFLIPGVVSNLWQATNGPHLSVLLGRMWSFLAAAAIAIVIGVSVMAGTKSEIMALVLGVLLCIYSVWALFAPRPPEPGRHEGWMSPAAGAVGGIFFGMSGLFIIPGLIYLESLRMPRDQFVQALGLTFVTISATLALSMTGFRLVTWELAGLSLIGLIPVGIGLWTGRRIRHRISEERYRRYFFVALFVTGIYMIVRTVGKGAL